LTTTNIRTYVRVIVLSTRVTSISYQKIVPVFQNVMAAAFVTVSRLYDRRFSPNREVLLGWVSWRNVGIPCMPVQWGFSLISWHQKRASLSLVRLHHILVSAIGMTRQGEFRETETQSKREVRERRERYHRLKKDDTCCMREKEKCMLIYKIETERFQTCMLCLISLWLLIIF